MRIQTLRGDRAIAVAEEDAEAVHKLGKVGLIEKEMVNYCSSTAIVVVPRYGAVGYTTVAALTQSYLGS